MYYDYGGYTRDVGTRKQNQSLRRFYFFFLKKKNMVKQNGEWKHTAYYILLSLGGTYAGIENIDRYAVRRT
jgi:hypothetical protein